MIAASTNVDHVIDDDDQVMIQDTDEPIIQTVNKNAAVARDLLIEKLYEANDLLVCRRKCERKTETGKVTCPQSASTRRHGDLTLQPNECSKYLAQCLREEQMTTNHTVARACRKYRWTGSVGRICGGVPVNTANISENAPLSKGKLCIVAFRRAHNSWIPQIGVVLELKKRISKKLADVSSISYINNLARCVVQMWFFKRLPRTGNTIHELSQEYFNMDYEVPEAPVILNLPGSFILYVLNDDSRLHIQGGLSQVALADTDNDALLNLCRDSNGFNAFCNTKIKSRQVAE